MGYRPRTPRPAEVLTALDLLMAVVEELIGHPSNGISARLRFRIRRDARTRAAFDVLMRAGRR